jgi:Rps23 Pro-64 3,4-dihydroxylase Tpa1-like proline 4-hydroxylase
MWRLGPTWRDPDALRRAFRAAQPFAHLVIDDLLEAAALDSLQELLEDEPVELYQSDLFAFDATAPSPVSPSLQELRDAFTRAYAPALAQLAERPLTRADLRAFAYRPGHYLLPHTDHQLELGRALAYAFYLPSPEPPTGGELELFACAGDPEDLRDISSARVITPRPNRLVVFEVSERSLHQVREVEHGLRLSLAGWFYP